MPGLAQIKSVFDIQYEKYCSGVLVQAARLVSEMSFFVFCRGLLRFFSSCGLGRHKWVPAVCPGNSGTSLYTRLPLADGDGRAQAGPYAGPYTIYACSTYAL